MLIWLDCFFMIIHGNSQILLLMILCWLFLPLWDSVIVLYFVVRYFMSILDLQSSWWGRESWLLCLASIPGVSCLLCGSPLWCHGFVCSLWLWYFLIIFTYYFGLHVNVSVLNLFLTVPWISLQCGSCFSWSYSLTFYGLEERCLIGISTINNQAIITSMVWL